MSTKVIFRRAEVFFLARACLPRRAHAVLPRSQVHSEKRKWRRTWKADEYLYSFKHQTEAGLHADVSEDRTKTFARLKIPFVDMTYPKGSTGASLPFPSFSLGITQIPITRKGKQASCN